MNFSDETRQRASRLKLMAFDVDGVLTDGSLYFTDEGQEIKSFNARDGHGLRMLANAGITLAVITGRKAPCVEWRMKNLGIELLFQGVNDKYAIMQSLLDRLGLTADEAGFMGDDVIDLRVMDLCGFAASPADSHDLAINQAHFVSSKTGGHGAAREVCEFILEAQGKLAASLAPFLPVSGK